MITCPKCGAENKPTAMVCRMCATPLGAASMPGGPRPERADSLPPTVVFSGQNSGQSESGSSNSQGIQCPTCQTMNEMGWAFCQQCGSKLQQSAPISPPPGQQRAQEEQRTVIAQTPINDPRFQPGQATVMDQPQLRPNQPMEERANTPVSPPAQRPPANDPYQHGKTTVPNQIPVSDPRFPPGKPTVVERTPVRDDEITQGRATIASQPPADKPPGRGMETVIGQSVPPPAKGTVPCPQCSHQNNPGSSFCAACGSPMTVAKTIVMSSVAAQPKGRLHLIMEGGQQGEIYELKDDTVIGRTAGDISFPHDGFMSGRHARIVQRGSSFILTDEGSRNGSFIRIKGEVELKPGDMILIGKQLFRFEV